MQNKIKSQNSQKQNYKKKNEKINTLGLYKHYVCKYALAMLAFVLSHTSLFSFSTLQTRSRMRSLQRFMEKKERQK